MKNNATSTPKRSTILRTVLPAIFLLALIVGTVFILRRTEYRQVEGRFILRRTEYRQVEGRIFGTTYHITYSSTHNLADDIQSALNEVDNALSMFNQESTLSRFNRGESYAPNALFDDVVELGLTVSSETDGAFDITVAPLVNAWGFGFKNRDNVTDAQIDSIRQFVGYQLLTFNKRHTPTLTRRDPRVSIDCGAIAKGYGVQHVAKMLEAKGCRNFMVEIGGEVVVKGQNPKGKRWTLGIAKPVDDPQGTNEDLQETIALTDRAVATSGNYRNFYVKGEKKYAHTIDPATGYPVQHSLLSATVVHPNCAAADAYATAFMVMGLERAKALVESRSDLEAYLIYADPDGNLQTWASKGFQQYIQK